MSSAKREEKSVAKETVNNKVADLGLLEEDDEFEEFPVEEEVSGDEGEANIVWEDNWDDDTIEDDFSNQLRAELESQTNRMQH